ncbi:MAG TPA: DHH family phosphoesterase [Parachlamydiaceae bacterium]|nr:DHH family phosphoesterase [Parachlamydiaceae bacterium]
MWRDIKKIIHLHENFVLTTHLNPDGDGIGAACAMTELLLQMGKKVRFVCDSPIPAKFSFLDYHHTHEVYQPNGNYRDCEVLIVLDTHKRERIGRLSELIDDPTILTLCIDHHEVAEPFTKHLAIDPKACSVGAMVYTLYKESGFDLNSRAANGIYVSIICDTGRFSYSSTTRKAHKIADECIKLGVDPDHMHTQLFQHVSLSETKLFAMALQGMETYLDNKVAVQHLSKEACDRIEGFSTDLEHVDLEYIHDFNSLVEDVQCFVLMRDLGKNRVRVSMRSKTDLDISHLVHSLGGGGHANAAGLFWEGPTDEIKSRILELLEQLLEKNKIKCAS